MSHIFLRRKLQNTLDVDPLIVHATLCTFPPLPSIGPSSNVSIVALGRTETATSGWLFVVDTEIITGDSLGVLD